MSEASQTVTLANKRGLHARASAKFVTVTSGLSAHVTVSKDGSTVVGTSIMGLMMLGAAIGDEIVIAATGDGSDDAVKTLVALVEDKFGED
jgi:phosphocarrier protein HPr